MLEIRAFGALELRDDSALDAVLTQAKRAALLAYLAVARPRGFHRRDTLLALFWPELDEAHARNALSQALSFLRRALPEGVLVTRGGGEVGLDPERVWCDVVAFEAAVAEGRWAAALELYRGALLAGLHAGDAAGFERWLGAERMRLRELAAGAAWSLADERLAAGDPVAAERVAQRALLLAPTEETPVRAFIEALAAAGDRAAALQLYERFEAVLEAELEVAPAPETQAVAEAVRNGEIEAVEPVPRNRQAGPEARRRRAGAAAGGPSVAEATVAGPASAGGGSAEVTVRKATGLWRRPRVQAGVGLVMALMLVIAAPVAARWVLKGAAGVQGTLIEQGVVSKYVRVLVADLTSASDPTLGMPAAEWLRAAIDQSEIIRPVDPAAVGAALRRMERDPSLPLDAAAAREVAVREGIPLVVTGQLEDLSGRYLVMLRLESGDGEVLGRFTEAVEADADHLVAALDRVGGQIRGLIGDSPRAIHASPPLEQVTTGSLDALKMFTQGVRIARWEGRERDALPLLREAVELDTTFATGYWVLHVIGNNLGLPGSREMIDKAYEYRDRVTEFERLSIETGYLSAHWQPGASECDGAIQVLRLFEAYVHRHPEDPRPLHHYAFYLRLLGRTDEAIENLKRAISLGYGQAVVYGDLFPFQLRVGDLEGAAETLREWREQLGESPYTREDEIFLANALGDYARVDSVVSAWIEDSQDPAWATEYAAYVDLLHGRVRNAMDHYQEIERQYSLEGNAQAWASEAWRLGMVQLIALGDTAGALRESPAAMAGVSGVQTAYLWVDNGLLFALAGDIARAEAAWDTLKARGLQNWALMRLLPAVTAIARGEPEQAIPILDEVEGGCTSFFGCPDCPALFRGWAHEAAGHPDSAIVDYRAYVDGTEGPRWDMMFLFDTLQRLGRLSEQLGHRDEAARYYAQAADLWNDADADLQPRVRRLRERAEALNP